MNDYTWINRYIKLKINSILAGLLFTFVETKYKRCSQVKLVFSVLPSLVSFWSSQFNLCWKKWIYAGLVWNCPVISTNKAYSASNKAINLKTLLNFEKMEPLFRLYSLFTSFFSSNFSVLLITDLFTDYCTFLHNINW